MADENNNKPLKIVFAEGCFDNFDGSQEELNELIANIQEWADSGELLENAILINDDLEDLDDEVLDLLPLLVPSNTRH